MYAIKEGARKRGSPFNPGLVKDKESGNPKLVGYTQQLLSTISKNEDALRGYCTHYFTDLLLNGSCCNELFDLWGAKRGAEVFTE